MANNSEIAIEHVGGSTPPAFRLTRSDGKSLEALAVPSPYEFPVGGKPGTLMKELRWYLEHFLDYPYPPEDKHAEAVLAALKAWGSQSFNAIFDRRDAGQWLAGSSVLQVRSDDPVILSWPWEALFDSQAGSYLVHHRPMERLLNKLGDPPKLGKLPKDRVNILLVVARPYRGDISYRSIARPLVDLIRSKGLPAHVDVLRPPTFDQLRMHLEGHPGYYHVLHFDGHGTYGANGGAGSPLHFRASHGQLLFEKSDGDPDPRSADELSTLLRRHALPAVVMNACQAGMMDQTAEDAFASVATSLLRSGMRSVVAMSYSLYITGAQAFLPAFYSGLFKEGSIAEGVRAGREEMLAKKRHNSPRGPYELEDWLLPVLYQQQPLDFAFAKRAAVAEQKSCLPPEVLKSRNDDFIGRDGPILVLERALQLKTPCILVQGMGGVGKTTLVRGFLFWLEDTGGLDAALWFDFRDIRSAEYVLNQTGQLFFGENFGVAKNKAELLTQKFRQQRVVMVWDNFESAATNLSNADRAELGRFLQAIRGTQGKVIVTSRDSEEWMQPEWRSRLELPGLAGDERWEFCEAVISGLNLGKVNREDPEMVTLMNLLGGHPLAMRVVLSKLERMPASKVLHALRGNIAALGLDPVKEKESSILGTLRFVEQGLAEELRPMLGLVGLHESYLDADYMEAMAKEVDPAWTRPLIDKLMNALAAAGLMRDMGQAIYELHPLLTSYLRLTMPANKACERAFALIMSAVADGLTPKEEHEQRWPFSLHGANFHAALRLSGSYAMEDAVSALTQSIAAFALNSRDFVQAARLYRQRAEEGLAKENWERAASSYHQLGMVAEEERDFKAAREWYLKSLATTEKQGNLYGAAISYHQLGRVAEEERDFKAAWDWFLKAVKIFERYGALREASITYHQIGVLTQEKRDYKDAREWYLKSLQISEKQGNLDGAARSYHQLGMVAEEERDFKTAREWHLKSLAIKQQQDNIYGAATSYHQLGMVAEQEHDFKTARESYLKAVTIFEKRRNLFESAYSYHQLGIVAQKEGDLKAAREWYLKSLSIKETQSNLHGAATTYGQLGKLAQEELDFKAARDWYLKALAIFERQGNLHEASRTYHNLGIVAGLEGDMKACSVELARCIRGFLEASDPHAAQRNVTNFLVFHQQASSEDKQTMEAVWNEAGLGPFPPQAEE